MPLLFVGQSHAMAFPHPILWCDDKYPYCVIRLCRGLAMNGDAALNPTLWYGHTPCYGAVINDHAARNPMLWYGRTPCYDVMINGHDAHYLYAMLR